MSYPRGEMSGEGNILGSTRRELSGGKMSYNRARHFTEHTLVELEWNRKANRPIVTAKQYTKQYNIP